MNEDYYTKNTFFIIRDLYHTKDFERGHTINYCSNVLDMMGIDPKKSSSECAHELENKIKLVQKTDNIKNVMVNIGCRKVNDYPTNCSVQYMSDKLLEKIKLKMFHREPEISECKINFHTPDNLMIEDSRLNCKL